MSDSAQSPASTTESGTVSASSPPNSQTSPPTSKPPPPSPQSPPDSSSGSSSTPPPASASSSPPQPPNQTPPTPKVPPPSTPPPVSPSPPSSSTSPPVNPIKPVSPPNPSPTSQTKSPPLQSPPQSQDSPSPPPSSENIPTNPPPDEELPSPPPSSPSSTLVPSTSLPPPQIPPSRPTPSLPNPPITPDPKLPESVPRLSPPSIRESPSLHRTEDKQSDGLGIGGSVGITIAGVIIAAIVFFILSRRKKKRMDGLIKQYRPPHSFSVQSEGYYRQATQSGSSERSDSFYPSTGPTGSVRGYGLHSGPVENAGIGNSKSWFTYAEIADMTHGFSRENLLGEGGFGCVYKGWLEDGKVVAVKQLKIGSGQGEREFRAEVDIISRVHHKHLVSLVGYCISDNHRSLVYEFVPNGTLEHHLHARGLAVMEWGKRVKIAIGSARGLAYLHEDCHPRIIHRDIKSANILIDNMFEAQVADFGLAKLSNDTHTHVSTRVMGTFGYMAPEYASSGKLTDRSDVFSFGVVLLELITGRKPVDPSQPLGDESLVEWARPRLIHALETGEFHELADPRLDGNYSKPEMFRMVEVAAACVRHSAPKRPRMVQVLRALDNEGDIPDLTNGVKFGQSTIFESRQNSANMQQFRRTAFGSSGEFSSDYYGQSGDYDRRSSGQFSGDYSNPASSQYNPGPDRNRPFNARGYNP